MVNFSLWLPMLVGGLMERPTIRKAAWERELNGGILSITPWIQIFSPP
jgi:hypothetical protein